MMRVTVIALLALLGGISGTPLQGAEILKRLVSLGPLNTENIYLLGAEDRLLADTRYCVRPEAARDKEKIGTVMQVSVEKIVTLRPDLVLATGLTPTAAVDKLRSLGIRVVRVAQPRSFDEICAALLELGRLLGLEERARKIIGQAREQVGRIRKRVAGLPRPDVFLQVGAQPLFSSVRTSFTNDFILLAGGRNVIGDRENGAVSYELVLAEDPEVIIIAVMGSEGGVAAREKRKWQRFSSLRAVRDNRVYILDPDLVCSPSPITFAQTLAVFARLLHPEAAGSAL